MLSQVSERASPLASAWPTSSIISRGGAVGLLFLDLTKVFDGVNHEKLFVKLRSIGFEMSTTKGSNLILHRDTCDQDWQCSFGSHDRAMWCPTGLDLGTPPFSYII